MFTTPAPVSFLDNAADCIEAGDEIGRRLYLCAHTAGVPFTPASTLVTETVLAGELSRPFMARFAGVCALSGARFMAGAEVRKGEIGIVTTRAIREWEVTYTDGRTVSRWATPNEAILLAALAAGRMVATLNNQGVKVYWMQKGDKVEEVTCTGGRTMRTNRKSPAALWSTVASKAQAMRVFA